MTSCHAVLPTPAIVTNVALGQTENRWGTWYCYCSVENSLDKLKEEEEIVIKLRMLDIVLLECSWMCVNVVPDIT